MPLLRWVAVIAVIVMTSSGAGAYTGNDLLRDCDTQKRTFSRGFCLGLVEGVWHMAVLPPDPKPSQRLVCQRKKASLGQVADIVKKWLRDNPERRPERASALIFLALRAAWPCR